jgi:hypothetical protein
MMPRAILALLLITSVLAGGRSAVAEPSAEATAAFNKFADGVEVRLKQNHQSAESFFSPPLTPDLKKRLQQGEFVIDGITPTNGLPLSGALLHDWRGTAFAPGAKAADFERVMKNFSAYPQIYSPQVLSARVLSQQGDHLQAIMRVRQKHVITVVLDTTYDVAFGQLDAQHGYSSSRSTKVSEIDSPGTSSEHALDAKDDHGFLWRLNTYWTYEEADGGLYLQIESVSLTRSVPGGLGWVVSPFIQKIPRESLEFTLRATSNALKK